VQDLHDERGAGTFQPGNDVIGVIFELHNEYNTHLRRGLHAACNKESA
jgi:hypothetical protein